MQLQLHGGLLLSLRLAYALAYSHCWRTQHIRRAARNHRPLANVAFRHKTAVPTACRARGQRRSGEAKAAAPDRGHRSIASAIVRALGRAPVLRARSAVRKSHTFKAVCIRFLMLSPRASTRLFNRIYIEAHSRVRGRFRLTFAPGTANACALGKRARYDQDYARALHTGDKHKLAQPVR